MVIPMSDSPIDPQAPSIEPLADAYTQAQNALTDPDFRPAALPDPVLLEMVTLAYRARAADRLESAAEELLRRLRRSGSMTVESHRTPDHEDLATHPAPHGVADPAPDGDVTPTGTPPDQMVPEDGSTREAIHDILMAALEQGLAVLKPSAQGTHDSAETPQTR
jgi:hypothetical protein